jgi:hypothetical protein
LCDWAAKLNVHIKNSVGFKENIKAPTLFEFWRSDQVSVQQFLDLADTFDIVLFRCNTGGAKVIRTYT